MKNKATGIVWGVILMAAGLETAPASPPCPPWQAREVRIGHQTWRVEVAFSPEERERGLSGRQVLPPGRAMWFVLPAPGMHGFWMRDMAFPVDLAWIAPQGRVIGVETLPPCGPGPCPIHYPPEPAGFVLEAAAHSMPDVADVEEAQASWLCGTD